MAPIKELNVIKKDWRRVDLKVALCYPNVYRAGMTGLTVKLLYALFNAREDVLCERFFIPTLREPLKSFESNQPLKKFDVVAFTLQYEEDYTNVLRMLLESDIPPRREDRESEGPLIIAGGPCATANPEPLSDFIDLFFIGEAEAALDPLIDEIKASDNPSRHVEEFADLRCVYVPKVSNTVKRCWIKSLEDAPHPLTQQIPLVDEYSPYMTVFGKAFSVEVVRGCSHRCRFCLIRCISLPKRERNLNSVEEIINNGMRYTPVNKVSLIGADLSSYSRLEELCEYITSYGFELSIPSIRPEAVTERLAKLLVKGKQRSISMAPDGSSPKMRRVANKGIEDEELVEAAKILLKAGLNQLKLYYIVGLPGETLEDVKGIAALSKRIADLGYSSKAIHLSINPLIPKPQTPFQWEKTPSVSYVRGCMRLLKKLFKGDNRFMITCFDPRHAQIQAFLSLGDRKIGKVIELTVRYGGGLGAWRRSLKECRISLEDYTKGKDLGESMPWDHIDIGLNRRYFIKEIEALRKSKEYARRQ